MWTLLLLVAAGAGLSFWGGNWLAAKNRPLVEKWRQIVQSNGFQMVASSPGPSLEARAGPLQIWIGHLQAGGGTRAVVMYPGLPGSSLVIQRESPLQLLKDREVEVGGGRFDERFSVQGPERLVHALCDAETRKVLTDLDRKSRLKVAGGQLAAETSDEDLPFVVSRLAKLGRRLAACEDVVERLAENARGDPEPGVRLNNLLVLARELRGDPRTAAALRRACDDASPEVRLRAARELGEEGRDTLLQLAQGQAGDEVKAQAIAWLGESLPLERARILLHESLRRRRSLTARACLERLGHSRDEGDVARLAEVVQREPGALAAVAARALGHMENTAAEPSLIDALARDEEATRLAAAEALGRVGSAAAVLPLKEAAESDRKLRRAVRQAIAGIQSRLAGASPGQLSLAEGEGGQLSLAAATGQLTLAESATGELSLASDLVGQLSVSPEEPGGSSAGGGEAPKGA